MDEEKQKLEGESLFSIADACPACGKTIHNMWIEHKKLIRIGPLVLVCAKCGCIFIPKSQIKYILEASEHRIIDPNSPQGRLITPEMEDKLKGGKL